MDETIKKALKDRAKSLSIQIAHKINEKKELEKELNNIINELTKTEAMIFMHRENKEKYHAQIKEKKQFRSEILSQKDTLLDRKHKLIAQLKEYYDETRKEKLREELEKTNTEIDEIFAQSNDIRKEMDELWNKAQETQLQINELTKLTKQLNLSVEHEKMKVTRKMAIIDRELGKLREQINTIHKKIKD